jgi:protein TonB
VAATVFDTLESRESGRALRLAVGLVLGLLVTLVLFWFMQYMIETADRTLDDEERGALVDFVRVERDETVKRRQAKPEKPPPPEAPPPQPPTPQLDNLDPTAEKIAIQAAPVNTDIEMTGGFSLGVGEGDYLPIVKVAPIYPQRAQSRGIEGYCTVQYTVTRQGTVKDVVVLEDDCTSSLFHRASVQAALKFKYKPRVIDGQAVEVPGVRNRFTYQFSED